MKPGSLVVRLGLLGLFPKVFGIIVREHTTDLFNNKWWDVLCDNEIVIEPDSLIELVETSQLCTK